MVSLDSMRLHDFSVNIRHAIEDFGEAWSQTAGDADITRRLIKVLRYQTVCYDNILSRSGMIRLNSLLRGNASQQFVIHCE